MFQYDNSIDYKSGCGFVFDVLNKDNIILSIIKHRNGQFVISGDTVNFYKDFKQAYIKGIAKVFDINESEVIFPPPVKSESTDVIKPVKKVISTNKVSPYIINPFTYELVYEPYIIKESSCTPSLPPSKPSIIKSHNNFTLTFNSSIFDIEYESVLSVVQDTVIKKEIRNVYPILNSSIFEIKF